MTRFARLAWVVLLLLAACQPSASPSPTGSAPAVSLAPAAQFEGRIDAAAVRLHLAALEAIADAHGGVRTAGTPGYEASVEYVARELREMGYSVETPEFAMPLFTELPGATIQIGDGPAFAAGRDFHAMIYSGGGDVTAPVVAIGFGQGERGGCGSDEWADLPAGAVAVVPPGPCFRRDVVLNAQDAGAAALIASFPQWPAGEVRRPTLLFPDEIDIPAISASAELGEALHEAADAGATVRLAVQTEIVPGTVQNVIAESHGIADRVIMLGGHLDSVHDGPGINDNGSGTAALLEVARLFAEERPGARVRFAFWGGEEYFLLGSRAYVQGLTDDQLGEISAYLNFDMLGSPNFVPFVYDGGSGALGSAEISNFLVGYLESSGIGAELTDLGGASDHASFADAGIPVGGIFSGASELKSVAQAEAFGGSADEPYDACYHLVCDRVDNVNGDHVAAFADAAAAVSLAIATGALAIP